MAPTFSSLVPAAGTTGVATDASISLDITDGVAVDPTTITILVADVMVYQAEVAQNDFVVVRTPISGGYHFEITHPDIWPYNTWFEVKASAKDTGGNPSSIEWQFLTLLDADCFVGPLNDLEASLLQAFSSVKFCERLRKALFASITTNGDPTESCRSIFLRAHSQELAPVLYGLVTPPTAFEARARLCNKATNLAVSDYLRRKTNQLPGAILELRALGLPQQHVAMLNKYAQDDQPSVEVPLVCVLVLLAKVLE
jgi:hypothetical protein